MLKMLLRSDVADKIGRIYKTGVAPSAEQRAEFAAARAARPKLAASLPGARPMASADPENYAVVGSVAQICIEGVLSEEPDFWAWLMGCDGTTYADIRDAFALAAADPIVKSVVLDVSSPGGYTDGLFETLAAIEAFPKSITVQASQACSAAYALAAMGGPIKAKGPASQFGSIGVACSFDFYESLETIDVTSTAAPDKRPDVRTPEGKAVVVAQLDALHELFADAIARGRSAATGDKYTVAKVNADFGRGSTMLADAAKVAGLIDGTPPKPKRGGGAKADVEGGEELDPSPEKQSPALAVAAPIQPPRAAGQETKRVNPMTKEELLAQFPQLHAALVAEGAVQGQAAERKRACAHIKLAKATGAREVADAAIASGASTMDEDVHADYMAAAIGKRETTARQTDSDEAGKILGGAAPAAEGGKDLGDEVADRMDALSGKKKAS